jgi:hypothetical protein
VCGDDRSSIGPLGTISLAKDGIKRKGKLRENFCLKVKVQTSGLGKSRAKMIEAVQRKFNVDPRSQ